MLPKTKNWLVFLLGLGSITEIRFIGSLGISELCCYALAPFIFSAHLELFKRLRFGTFFVLLALWAGSAVLADFVAGTYLLDRWKGIAPIYSIFAVTVCSTVLLADDISRFRWFLVGSFISALIASFVFTPAGVMAMAEETSESAIVTAFDYSAWYYGTIGALFLLPVQIGYQIMPLWVSIGLVASGAVMQLLLGGRGAFLIAMISLVFLWFGRNSRFSNYRPRRLPVVLLFLIMMTVGILAKGIYTVVVTQGYMGDQEMGKYETQTKTGSSAWSLLLAGRGSTFAGFFAALDKPFLGHGSKALDTAGYYQAFVDKYGDAKDARDMYESYGRKGIGYIPAHSQIIAAWLWHGLGGLLFWLYVLWLLYKNASVWMWYVPGIIGWFSLVVTGMMWNILFSPLGSRTNFAVTLTCLLLSRVIMRQTQNAKLQRAGVPMGNE